MTNELSDRASIVGVGQTEFSNDAGRTELRMAVEAITAALSEAGLEPSDVDGLVTFSMDHNSEIEIARNLGVPQLRYFGLTPHGGGGTCGVFVQAAMAVVTGVADVVVCYRSIRERSWYRFGSGNLATTWGQEGATAEAVRYGWYNPYGLTTPASYGAMFARRYMHVYGLTSEDFGRVAVAERAFAATNPAARWYGKPITLSDHQLSPFVVEPLRLLDCCMETDAAFAAVVTTTERARDLRSQPVLIRAAAQGAGPDQEPMTSFYREDITQLMEMGVIARELWTSSGLGPSDIDCAMFYDHFTPFVLAQLEEFGFCGRGEAAAFVAEGNLFADGGLPVNTHGGQLGEAYLHGMNGVAEAVRQVRGNAANQLGSVENVLVTAGSGVPSSGLILAADRR